MKTKIDIRELDVFSANPDWEGKWTKDDVERDMAELEIEDNWVSYTLERNFEDCLDMTQPIIDAFASGALRKATLRLCGNMVTIETHE